MNFKLRTGINDTYVCCVASAMAFPMSDVTAEYKLNRFIAVAWMEL